MKRADKIPNVRARALWSASLRWTTAAGLACAVALWGWLPPAMAVIIIAVIAALWTWSLWTNEDPAPVRRSIDAGVWAGLTMTGLVALVAAIGVVGLVIVVLLGGTAPILRSRAQWSWMPQRSPSLGALGTRPTVVPPSLEEPRLTGAAMTLPEDCAALGNAELVMAWRRSFVHLQHAASRAETLAAVELRQRYLDELCRRHPEGIASWLASGARASGNPLPYLGDQHRRPD